MTWDWATVTDTSPLEVRVDGDTAPLVGIDVVTLVSGLAVNDRVRIHLDGVLIVVGKIQ